MGLAALGLSNATLQALAAALQRVVMAGMVSALLSPTPVACGKGHLYLLATTTLHVRGGRIYQPSSNLGCGCAREGKCGGASHPKPGPVEVPAVFSESLLGGGHTSEPPSHCLPLSATFH